MDEHNFRVEKIAVAVGKFYQASTPFRIYHGNTNSTRPSSKTYENTLDISGLNHVLSIDETDRTCLVEPNVPMDVLVTAALQHNLVPPVIPEFPGITVGGAFAGTAGESSSFRHGFFDDCVEWAEIILANGNIVHASDHENEDLFHGAKGTFGTLGVGTLFKVRLTEAKKFVRLRYEIISQGVEEAKAIMEAECRKSEEEVQFVDGIMFSKDTGVILVGKMTNDHTVQRNDMSSVNLPVVTFHRAWDEWFYLHVQHVMKRQMEKKTKEKNSQPYQDLVPLTDYLFRYDRGGFWTGIYAFEYFVTPFNRVTRWALDYFMHTRTMYHALHRSGLIQQCIVQDMAVPWHNVEPFLDWLDEKLKIYPLWLAPLKMGKGGIQYNANYARHGPSGAKHPEFLLNVGVWGFPPNNTIGINRALEAKLVELKGIKWLYSQTFYTAAEFWAIYDRKWYDALRVKYSATAMHDVYEKVGGTSLNQHNSMTGIWQYWPLAGVYGVISALKGGDYLRKR